MGTINQFLNVLLTFLLQFATLIIDFFISCLNLLLNFLQTIVGMAR